MPDLIEIKHHENIAEVSLNRPQTYNAFNLEMVSQLADHLMALAKDEGIKGIVITGKGKAFCAGGDLKHVVESAEGVGPAFHRLAAQFHLAVTEIRRMRKAVVAAIHGVAAGGGFSLALACDFRVIEKTARLIQAYTSNGLCIDGGGTFSLPRVVGLARALEIAAFDNPISAQQALEWGMVTKVAEDGKAFEEALSMLRQLVKRSVHSFGLTKKLLTDSFTIPFESQIEMERVGLCECAEHPDGQEGLNAFVEKRKPKYD